MGNCLRRNPDDFEASESSFHTRSLTRSNQQQPSRSRRGHSNSQQPQQLQQQQPQQHHDQQHQRPRCRHHAATDAATTTASTVTQSTANATAAAATSTGKNQPLRRERIRWTCDHRLTAKQLRAKRDEFWDTAPAFDGRREIWDALRAAAAALESGDHELAQAILNGAGVTLPRGLLTDSYDELGTRYQLPLYVLTAPTNLVESSPSNSSGSATGTAANEVKATAADGETAPAADAAVEVEPATPVTLKLRLSNAAAVNSRDIRMPVSSGDTVARAKQQLARLASLGVGQRWYCYGRQLTDKMKVGDCPIPRGFVVQVVLATASCVTAEVSCDAPAAGVEVEDAEQISK